MCPSETTLPPFSIKHLHLPLPLCCMAKHEHHNQTNTCSLSKPLQAIRTLLVHSSRTLPIPNPVACDPAGRHTFTAVHCMLPYLCPPRPPCPTLKTYKNFLAAAGWLQATRNHLPTNNLWGVSCHSHFPSSFLCFHISCYLAT